MNITAFKSVIDETKQWMSAYAEEGGRAQARAQTDIFYRIDHDISWFISETIKQMQAIMNADAKLPDDVYVNDLKYKALVTRMLSSQEWAKQKLWLWLDHQEIDIYIGSTSLKSAHRQWLSFLKQRKHAVAVAGSNERKTAAVKILQCKGLMVTDNVSTDEADSEPLIYAAAADGWALDDLQVMTSALQWCSAVGLTRARLQFVIDAGASLAAANKRWWGAGAVDSHTAWRLMRSGDSALHAAAESGDALAVQALVEAGADVKKLGK